MHETWQSPIPSSLSCRQKTRPRGEAKEPRENVKRSYWVTQKELTDDGVSFRIIILSASKLHRAGPLENLARSPHYTLYTSNGHKASIHQADASSTNTPNETDSARSLIHHATSKRALSRHRGRGTILPRPMSAWPPTPSSHIEGNAGITGDKTRPLC